MTDPIGMAAGFGAGDAAGSSKAAHAATMAAIEQQRMAGSMAHSEKLHAIEKMVMMKKVSAHVAWLRIGIFSQRTSSETIARELKKLDPNNNLVKKVESGELAGEIFDSVRGDSAQVDEYVKRATNEINKVISE